MDDHSNPSGRVETIMFPIKNIAHSATRHTYTCTTTTVKKKANCAARSVRQTSRSIIVLKERLKPNTFVRTATTPCSAGKLFCTSLFTNAAMIIANTALTRLTSSTRRKKSSSNQNLLNSNSATPTANIYSRLRKLIFPGLSNLLST